MKFFSIAFIAVLASVGSGLLTTGGSAHADTVTVKIEGVERAQYENVATFLTILQNPEVDQISIPLLYDKAAPKVTLSESQLKRAHRLAPKEIKSALQPFGFYAPTVTSTLNRDGDGDQWIATYKIIPGRATIVHSVDFSLAGEGKSEPRILAAMQQSKLHTEQPLSHIVYEATKKATLQAALDAGYLNANYSKSELRVDERNFTAEISLHLDTGPLFYFGDIDIQQTALDRTIIERFIPFKSGQRFESSKLIKLQLSLEDTEYFSEVDVRAQRADAKNNRIPIVVMTTAAKPQRYSIGAGFGTDTGPRANLGINNIRVNRKGHQFRTDLRVSNVISSIQAQYLIPVNHGTTDHIAFTANATSESIADTDTESTLVGVSRFESWRGFQRSVYLNYEREAFDIGNGQQKIQLLVPGFSLSRKSATDLVFPRRGYSVNLDVHGASESLASDTDFLQAKLTAAAVWPLGKKSRLLIRGEYGATETDDFDLLPLSQRFFAGGDRSVRGYDYQELSPVNDEGRQIGGQYLATFSVEADYLFYNGYGVAGFIDAGNVSSDVVPELRYSVGLGLRYRSPIGMIRLDIANPIDNADESFRVHVSIGADL